MYWPQWLTKPAFAAAFSVVSLISGVIVATNINSAEGAIVSSTESSRLSIFTENAPGLLRAPSTSHHP